jgi:hypothetical protein
MDLAVEYHGLWNIIEIKMLKDGKSFDYVMKEGIKQTLGRSAQVAAERWDYGSGVLDCGHTFDCCHIVPAY